MDTQAGTPGLRMLSQRRNGVHQQTLLRLEEHLTNGAAETQGVKPLGDLSIGVVCVAVMLAVHWTSTS